MDETEYLLSEEANARHLRDSLHAARSGGATPRALITTGKPRSQSVARRRCGSPCFDAEVARRPHEREPDTGQDAGCRRCVG